MHWEGRFDQYAYTPSKFHCLPGAAGTHLREPHLFHPAILGGSKRALDAALGLGTTCLDQLDVELAQSPRKLGFADIIRLPLLVRLEDAMPIRVQRQRPTMLLQPSTQQIEMRLDRVGLVETRQRP